MYDDIDRVSEIMYNSGEDGAFETAYKYVYNSDGALYSVEDCINGETTVYKYDSLGNLSQSYVYDTEENVNKYSSSFSYDQNQRLESVFHSFDYLTSGGIDDQSHFYFYSYNDRNMLEGISFSDDMLEYNTEYTYDYLGRVTSKGSSYYKEHSGTFYSGFEYTYKTVSSLRTTTLIDSYTISIGMEREDADSKTYKLAYDANGNITQITDSSNNILYRYGYDALGQLIREDNAVKGKSYKYNYDGAGNLVSKATYDYTTGTLGEDGSSYDYFTYSSSAWGDLLTGYDNPDNSDYGYITYDNIGNPTLISDIEGDSIVNDYYLIWNGRQLMQIDVYDGYTGEDTVYQESYYYTYNADGIRTSKTVGGIKYEYILSGSQIIGMRWMQNGVEYLVEYIYDEIGSPVALKYRTSADAEDVYNYYFFEKNLQGDIVAVYSENSNKIGSYIYDAWGNVTIISNCTQGTLDYNVLYKLNPFRYRGYYYDTETNWYYLQSRYYNPEWGRFINADAYLNANGDIVGYNMFAYCSNNPVMFVDPSGQGIAIDDALIWGFVASVALVFAALVASYQIAEHTHSTDIDFSFDSSFTGNTNSEEIYYVITRIDTKHPGEYTVYTLVDGQGVVRYVGRTKNLNKRLAAHSRSPKTGHLTLGTSLSGLTWSQARGLEQIGMIFYNTLDNGLNSINGISFQNPNRIPYLTSAWDYLYNQVSNELYNIFGQ